MTKEQLEALDKLRKRITSLNELMEHLNGDKLYLNLDDYYAIKNYTKRIIIEVEIEIEKL